VPRVVAYQHGIYPRSEAVVAATRGIERGRNTADDVDRALAEDLADVVAAQREAGLDLFSDGLLRWQDIFRPLVRLSGGLTARSLVRWFDNNSFFRAPEVSGDLTLDGPVPAEVEWDDLPEPRVATLPSPYLFSRAAHSTDDRNALMMDLTREVLRPVAQGLVERGAGVIHLEEPWLAYHGIEGSDWDDFEKAVGEVRGATESATLVLHTYFGDAGPLADRLRNLPVDAVGVDLTQTDPSSLGSGWAVGLLAGVMDGRRSVLEPVEEAVALVRTAADAVGAPAVYVSSNCELEFLSRDLARRKVLRLGEVAARLREELA
jgi:5-methyltetrahydropteroyltriglutamate--homocysteine methyltransferase